MFNLSNDRPEIEQQKWRSQVDCFAIEYESQLAALAWGLKQEWGENNDVLGIDLKPNPHFVVCSSQDLENLNKKTKGQIQEVLGIADNYDPQMEVVIIVIGEGQIKLINFQPETTPPESFAATDGNLDRLIKELETAIAKYIV